MSNVAVLLDKAKTTLKASSDAELARHLGVTRGSVSNWRTGRNLPDVVQCATLAGLTGEPLARVLGIVGEARAISREEKAVWHKLAANAAMLVLILGASTLVGARDTHAANQSASSCKAVTAYALCETHELTKRNVVDLALAQMVHDANTGTPPGLHGGICTNCGST